MKFFFTLLATIAIKLSNAQSPSLAAKLKTADSVVLISHEMASGATNKLADSLGNKIKLLDLVSNGRLTVELVNERKKLTSFQISKLSKILTYRYRPLNESISAGCFVPHHAIIIFKNKRASYIDLCFHYVGYETSTDIKDLEIRDDKMKKLYAIFKEYGFTYEMDLEKK